MGQVRMRVITHIRSQMNRISTTRILLTILTTILILFASNAQKKGSTDSSTVIYNYFTQQYTSIVYDIGSVFLMPSDSVSFKNDNVYETRVTDSIDGYKEVFFKNRLLFRYEMRQGKVEGLGYCFYPFSSTIAIQGEFVNNKLNGWVFFQDKNGKVIEVMRYKHGRFEELLYHWNFINTKKNLWKISKRLKAEGVTL